MIYRKLKELREFKGLTQKQMASALNKEQSTYSDIENGKSKLDAELIPAICNILEINPDELFENKVQFTFNEKVENGYASYIETVNTHHLETLSILKNELGEKNKTIDQLMTILQKKVV